MFDIKKILKLKLQSETGVTTGFVVAVVLAIVAAGVATTFAMVTAFIWLSMRMPVLSAGMTLLAVFLALSVLFAIIALVIHKRTMKRAERELSRQQMSMLMQPQTLIAGIGLARGLGIKKLLVTAALGFLATGISREVFSGRSARNRPLP